MSYRLNFPKFTNNSFFDFIKETNFVLRRKSRHFLFKQLRKIHLFIANLNLRITHNLLDIFLILKKVPKNVTLILLLLFYLLNLLINLLELNQQFIVFFVFFFHPSQTDLSLLLKRLQTFDLLLLNKLLNLIEKQLDSFLLTFDLIRTKSQF